MKTTSRFLRLARTWFLAIVLGTALWTEPTPVMAQEMRRAEAVAASPVLPAAWYDQFLNSRSRTIQVVFVIVLIGAFMLRRSS